MARRRLSLVIDGADEAALAPFLTQGTAQREAAGCPDADDAEILCALLVRGVRALEDERLAAGYEQLAAGLGAQQDVFVAESRAAMRRVLDAEFGGGRAAA